VVESFLPPGGGHLMGDGLTALGWSRALITTGLTRPVFATTNLSNYDAIWHRLVRLADAEQASWMG